MTLEQWQNRYGVPIGNHYIGAEHYLYIHRDYINDVNRWDLYHLTDFAVSSLCAGVAWLARRVTTEVLR